MKHILRQILVVAGQQVAALHTRGVGDICAPTDLRLRIAKQIGSIPADLGQRIARPHCDRGQVDRNQTPVTAPRNAGTGQARVGVAAYEDALALAARDNKVGARIQSAAVGNQYARCVPAPWLAGIGNAEFGIPPV